MFDEACSLDPENITARRGAARARLSVHDYLGALAHADRFLLDRPRDWMTIETRADALMALRRFDEAIAAYKQCVDERPLGYWVPWERLARAQTTTGAIDDARGTYRELLTLHPEHPQARSELLRLEASPRDICPATGSPIIGDPDQPH